MDKAALARQHHQHGRLDLAAPLYRDAIAVAPRDAGLQHDYAVLLMQSGHESAAIAPLEQAIAILPDRPDSYLVAAACMRSLGRLQEGTSAAAKAVQLLPGDPLGWLLLGSLQVLAGNATQAEASLRQCLVLDPGQHEAWHYLGEALQAQSRWRDAAAAYAKARVAQPAELFNIANCAEQAGELGAARAGFAQMCVEFPMRTDSWVRLAHVSAQLCDFEAERKALAGLQASASHTGPTSPPVEPFPLSYLPVDDSFRRQELRRYSAQVLARASGRPRRPFRAAPAQGKVRIGYLSPDFGDHAVGILLSQHFAAHDRDVVDVFGYSLREHHGSVSEQIRKGFDVFHQCGHMASGDIASRIEDDGIDVLIDLAGFTQGARPEVLAMRPAPVQFGWLGFIHGHQAPWLDAILLDEHLLPHGAAWPYDDQVIRLPGTLLPGSPLPRGRRDRAAFGLPERSTLLGSFNNAYKLDATLVQAWVRLLAQADEAHLLVALPEAAHQGFIEEWSRSGGDRRRLHLQGLLPVERHADRVASCDLVLDAFRYQGGATSMDAIHQGVPVISREGNTPLARLGVSVNRFLGMESLVCADTDAYIERAASLANDPSALGDRAREMTQRVEARGLFDPRRAARAIEQACLLASHRQGASHRPR